MTIYFSECANTLTLLRVFISDNIPLSNGFSFIIVWLHAVIKCINDVCTDSEVIINVWKGFILERFIKISKHLFNSAATYFNELYCCSHFLLHAHSSKPIVDAFILFLGSRMSQ